MSWSRGVKINHGWLVGHHWKSLKPRWAQLELMGPIYHTKLQLGHWLRHDTSPDLCWCAMMMGSCNLLWTVGSCNLLWTAGSWIFGIDHSRWHSETACAHVGFYVNWQSPRIFIRIDTLTASQIFFFFFFFLGFNLKEQ